MLGTADREGFLYSFQVNGFPRLRSIFSMTDLHRSHISVSASHQLPAKKEQQVQNYSQERAENAPALCAHRAGAICIGQGRCDLSQSVTKEVEMS